MSGHTRGFRRRNARQQYEERFGPNMTPMVDVVLVILIFFMAGTTFISREWFLRTESFRRGTATTRRDPLELPPVWLTISLKRGEDGNTLFTGLGTDPTTGEDIGAFSARLGEFARATDKSKIVVVLAPAPDVPYRDVVAAHEACAAAGIERFGLSQ